MCTAMLEGGYPQKKTRDFRPNLRPSRERVLRSRHQLPFAIRRLRLEKFGPSPRRFSGGAKPGALWVNLVTRARIWKDPKRWSKSSAKSFRDLRGASAAVREAYASGVYIAKDYAALSRIEFLWSCGKILSRPTRGFRGCEGSLREWCLHCKRLRGAFAD